MKRNSFTEAPNPIINQELRNRTAFHEAGHAAAIYFLNKNKQLPPVFFQISIKEIDQSDTWPAYFDAQVEDGRLIHSLPISAASATESNDKSNKGLLLAFEADVVNLLVGSIAEAKYVASCDGEVINPKLINLEALRFYGGASDLKIVHEYLDCFIPSEQKRKIKIDELFNQAFDFIEEYASWQAISTLANYILDNQKTIITCEEAISVLDGD